ncbi:MAG: peptidase, partial [Bacteroidetes bacterium]|nr:peptidase [Bacteroidota bacterium]
HQALGITKKFAETPKNSFSYEIGHHIGLSLKQEYHLLTLNQESKRLSFIKKHLETILNVVMETERLKARAKLNGHYKNVIPPK